MLDDRNINSQVDKNKQVSGCEDKGTYLDGFDDRCSSAFDIHSLSLIFRLIFNNFCVLIRISSCGKQRFHPTANRDTCNL